jgi:uncharacterized protein (TIGR00369 family)
VTDLKGLYDRILFVKDLGVELADFEPGRSRVQLNVQPRHGNGSGVVHGGVLMTLLDVAMAMATRGGPPGTSGAVTVEMKTTFMQAGALEGRLIATGTCVHRSATMAFCESEIRDGGDRLIARGNGTFKYRKHLPGKSADA